MSQMPERFIGKPIRPVTEDERAMMTHISMWGSDGYPVRKCGSRHWTWDFRSVTCPRVFPTKREATASFERFADMIRDCMAFESWERAVAAQAARGTRDDDHDFRCDSIRDDGPWMPREDS